VRRHDFFSARCRHFRGLPKRVFHSFRLAFFPLFAGKCGQMQFEVFGGDLRQKICARRKSGFRTEELQPNVEASFLHGLNFDLNYLRVEQDFEHCKRAKKIAFNSDCRELNVQRDCFARDLKLENATSIANVGSERQCQVITNLVV